MLRWSPRSGAAVGIRVALFVHDLLPIRRPEFFPRSCRARAPSRGLPLVLPQAGLLLTFAEATAQDLARVHARGEGSRPRRRWQAIPAGAGFIHDRPKGGTAPGQFAASRDYALCVSTLEPRKNHALLFRVWQRLLQDMPRSKVPLLVLVGRIGWLSEDLMQQMANTGFLGGKIQLLEDVGDDQLAEIYRHCRFTVFPSHGEGLGLPVSESLAFGKAKVLCLQRTGDPGKPGVHSLASSTRTKALRPPMP